MIIKCNCKHEAQDKLHGAGNRVHNSGKGIYRCTVCKDTKKQTADKKEELTK